MHIFVCVVDVSKCVSSRTDNFPISHPTHLLHVLTRDFRLPDQIVMSDGANDMRYEKRARGVVLGGQKIRMDSIVKASTKTWVKIGLVC